MSGSPKDRDDHDISRRDFVKNVASIAVTLPFALIIPSNAPNVITEIERLRPSRERDEAFRKKLQNMLAQIPAPRPTPTPLPRPIPPPIKKNTPKQRSKNTQVTKATFSGTPPKSDDTQYETIFDGWETYYILDEN